MTAGGTLLISLGGVRVMGHGAVLVAPVPHSGHVNDSPSRMIRGHRWRPPLRTRMPHARHCASAAIFASHSCAMRIVW